MSQRKPYTTLRPFAHRGRVLAAGETVTLHPKQAKYLLGTHLSEHKPDAKPAKSNQTKGEANGKH
jgi:hypothetical protein